MSDNLALMSCNQCQFRNIFIGFSNTVDKIVFVTVRMLC